MEQLQHALDQVPWLLTALDLIGVFFFATSGALLASRKGFDFVGSVFLSLLAGLGGGVTRDVLLDRGLPASLDNPIYLAPPLLVSLLVYVKAIAPHRLNLTITAFDAGGLALFTVTGAMIALEHGANPVACVVIATVTALGGGMLRDIVANEVPSLFDPRGVYAMPTVVGAIVSVLVGLQGLLNVVTGFLIAVLIFTIRMLGYRYQWRLPGADISMDRDSIDRLRAAAVQAQEAARRRTRLGRRAYGPLAKEDAEELAAREASAPEGFHYDADGDVYTRDIPVVPPAGQDPRPRTGPLPAVGPHSGSVPSVGPRTGSVPMVGGAAAAGTPASGDRDGQADRREVHADSHLVGEDGWDGWDSDMDLSVTSDAYASRVQVEDYDPQTETITVIDRASGQVARLDPATGIMDVTDPRTGWTRSYDAPEDDWVKRDEDSDQDR
ncbi:trimeric intracellular cation channel family protein [Micrococcus sp. FDAARGOS_333]|uniref:trimeric intracellular cation channel family protein n=1 Tax=Micrococcus sp. FDAARGOS_333 TaxID=1930558 RepID=UPI000B4E81BB|nr:trimeric intracellular cation channel family protein [Micrococcus sp. FDAARGOS_333]